MANGINMSKIVAQKAALEERLSTRSGGGAKFWRPGPGVNMFRVLPPWTDDETSFFAGQFWREVSQHWNVSEDQKGPILCPDKTPGLEGECPICEFVDVLKSKKSNVDAQEQAKQLRAKVAYLINIVDLKDAAYTAKDVAEYTAERPDQDVPFAVGDPKIQVYAAPSTVFNQILGIIKTNELDITDLDAGHNLTLTKNGSGLTTKYELQIVIKPSKAALPAGTALPDLSQIGRAFSYDELVNVLSAGAGGGAPASAPRLKSTTASDPVLPDTFRDGEEDKAEVDPADALGASLRASMRS